MVEAIQKAVQDICLSVLGVIWGVCLFHWVVAMTRRFFMVARAVGLAVCFSITFVVAVMFGGSKTNSPPAGVMPPILPPLPQSGGQTTASQMFYSCGGAVTNSDWLARGAYEDWAWKCNVLIGRRLAYGTLVTSLFNGAGRDLRDLRDIRDGNFRSLSSRRSWRSRRSRWRLGT